MDDEQSALTQELLTEMRRGNALTIEMIRVHKDWRLALRQGVLTGLGGVLGATLLVSLLLWILQPLRRLEVLKDPLDRIAAQLERKTVIPNTGSTGESRPK